VSVIITNRQRTKKINTRLLRQIVNELLAELKTPKVILGINLVGARKMTLMNETFLQHEGPTDVITFDYAKSVGQASSLSHSKAKYGDRRDACPTLHGEVFICVDEAISQSRKFKTTWQSEIVRYIIHGVLHLLGHDDLKSKSWNKMKREENRLLRMLCKKFSLAQIGGGSKLRA
jgi:probable rRNA maturation factor